MSKLRRYYADRDLYFVTSVTFLRSPILLDNDDLLRSSFESTRVKLQYESIAWVILPDHIHMVVDVKDHNLSDIMHRIKLTFLANYNRRVGRKSGRVWQHRFWDHIIRDQDDLNRHIDYIHYNPVKHGLVASPFDYKNSSIHEYHADGYYGKDWGGKESPEIDDDFGE